MKPGKLSLMLVAGAVGVSACSDMATNPIEPTVLSSSAVGAGAGAGLERTGKHIVLFGSGISKGFAERVAQLGGTVEAAYGQIGVAVVDGLSDADAAALASFSGVQKIEADVIVQWLDPVTDIEVASAENAAEATANPAGAFFFPRQWHLRAIGADQAWAAGRVGSPDVKVAILDTGLSPTHPDLVGRIDHELSKSFVPFDDPFVDFYFPGMPNWIDLHYHGTHVGATVSSNASAAAGVTSGVTLIAVKVLNVNGSGSPRVCWRA
jgi:subtilisin family serine protease